MKILNINQGNLKKKMKNDVKVRQIKNFEKEFINLYNIDVVGS